VHLKAADIISAERVMKSEKLIKLIVHVDEKERQVIAGIGKSYSPEDLIGKKVVLVANLKPAKLMGMESNGMILAAEKKDGSLHLLTLDDNIKNGTKVK
jgi:methionyl-tRNA synthetase